MPLGSNYTIQTVEYNTYDSPRYWQSASHKYSTADDETNFPTDADVSALVVDDSDTSSLTSSSDTYSAGASAGPYIVTLAGGLAIAILCAMI
jgi:hypothetical protein